VCRNTGPSRSKAQSSRALAPDTECWKTVHHRKHRILRKIHCATNTTNSSVSVQFTTPCKDDIRQLADLKQQITQKMILYCSTSPKCHCAVKFGTPSIFQERLELEISNLARRFITRGTDEKNTKLGQRGSENGHHSPMKVTQ